MKNRSDNSTQRELSPKKTEKDYAKDNEVDDKLIGDDRDVQQAQQPPSLTGKEDQKKDIGNNNY